MQDFDPDAPLIFIHVPKCAGTTLRNIFRRWYKQRFVTHYPDPSDPSAPKILTEAEMAGLARPPVIFGHFNRDRGLGIEQSYPKVGQLATILRDPFDVAVSTYTYLAHWAKELDQPQMAIQSPLDAYLGRHKPAMMLHLPAEMTVQNCREIFEERFVALGVTEHMPASLAHIANVLGQTLPPGQIPVANASGGPTTGVDELRGAFRARHPLEYAAFDTATELVLSRQLAD